ncbi:MAG: NUDIX hydrolase [Actinomycetia bacterium]|nr:NUDIX hydrolase [Actinomycetes bacterium]
MNPRPGLLPAGHRALDPSAHPGVAREAVAGFDTDHRVVAEHQAFILDFIAEHPDVLHRTCLDGHLTGSAVVVDAAGRRVLLMHHTKLGRWLQPGGHADGNANLAAVALREATEETGIEGLLIDPDPVDLDVHSIPERGTEPTHWHLDVRFLVRAPEGAVMVGNDESLDLRWFEPCEVATVDPDGELSRLIRSAMERTGGDPRL